MIPSRVRLALVDVSDPMDVDAVNPLSSGQGKGSSSPRDGCLKCGGAQFQRDCYARKNTGKQSSGKGKQSKSWSKSERKGKSKDNKAKKSKGTKGAKGSHKGKTSKTGLSGLENSKSEARSETQEESAQTRPSDTSWNDGWNCDEWNDGRSFDELMELCWMARRLGRKTFDTSASSFFAWRFGSRCHE